MTTIESIEQEVLKDKMTRIERHNRFFDVWLRVRNMYLTCENNENTYGSAYLFRMELDTLEREMYQLNGAFRRSLKR